ncbi:sensor histidine kinase [Anaerocolumna xylanovorans]|uniref:histidine kinase n=1 Tax=Anaerocolumna xylanovorans DSM 12503 TaxID=1121345 RepID=A0A1M7XXB9_9FIRM|nr:histidine kinase [Anaerocolumna xylanovorans]SHO43287.1 Signal transduction histidine kinase [Anaerocolumna xylanovorans DSM 12503]
MQEHLEMRYFVFIKLMMVVAVAVYAAVFAERADRGIPYQVLLVTALLFMSVVVLELMEEKRESGALLARKGSVGALAAEVIFTSVLIWGFERDYIYLLPMVFLDIIIVFRQPSFSYPAVYLGILTAGDKAAYFAAASFILVLYYQHYIIVKKEQVKTEASEEKEEELKRYLDKSEIKYRLEIDRNRLYLEDRILEEKVRLSQALHDKLGHSINGSVYQLEAVKVLMEKDREESKAMLQTVIDNLRSSMDEIRVLLRQERPGKRQLAFIQLNSLCEDCRKKFGIEAEFSLTGNGEDISGKYWEIILDNCFEAVSNALKYAFCTRITIEILVMNRIVRCTVSDNGKGCGKISEGMGLDGMRRRVREVNGFISFAGEEGFVINMLLPIEGGQNERE